MSCEKYRKMISDWLDGCIHPSKERKLFSHLEKCRECRNYLEVQQKIKKELMDNKIMENSDEWWDRFEGQLRERIFEIKENGKARAINWLWKYLPALAGSLAVLLLVIFISRLPSKDETELLMATALSYEDTYLGINQLLQEDSDLALKISDELEKNIYEEINGNDESRVLTEIENYHEQDSNEYLTNNFQNENISLEERR